MSDELADSLRKEIGQEPHISSSQLTVEVQNHDTNIVVLVGRVRTYYQKQMAQETARKVINKLDVRFSIRNDIEVDYPSS